MSVRITIAVVAFWGLIPALISVSSCRRSSDQSSAVRHDRVATDPVSANTLRDVTVLPYWVPSSQFAGYYTGLEKGIFRKHGINLKILPFNSRETTESLLQDRKADFALLWMVSAMEVREKGLDIVNIAQLSCRSSLMFITRNSSGIEKLEDMNGKRAGIWTGFELQPEVLFKKFNLKVEMISIGPSNNLFLQNAVDIINANWFDEYHSILNNGIDESELNKFFFADYGLNFLEDGIYCRRELRVAEPVLCREFVQATLESWDYVFRNPEEAIEIVIRYAEQHNQPVNRSHQQWMLNAYKSLYSRDSGRTVNSLLLPVDYSTMQKIMLESNVLSRETPYDSFYMPSLQTKQTY
jgi:NitT/TauT family transport system substrate-binding protein